jgi:hypothetical protein
MWMLALILRPQIPQREVTHERAAPPASTQEAALSAPPIPAGKRFGEGRDRAGIFGEDCPIDYELKVIASTATVGRLLRDLAGRTAVPSIRHRLRERRHGGIVRTGPVNDRG